MDAVYTRCRDNNPSFSSTLLDEIYRSIDEQPTGDDCFRGEFDGNRCFQGGLVRKWMEDEACGRPVVVGRRSAAADLDRGSIQCGRGFNSSSSSSDCSSAGRGGGGRFCSSEGEFSRPRPIRTGVVNQREGFVRREDGRSSYGHGDGDLRKVKQESKFVKTKSKAMKIYSDLKKVKQPISPGGRLSSFLNSLFVTGNAKKSKTSSASAAGCTAAESRLDRKSKSANASTCSSASSFSRSCLSNTPSSRGKSSNGLKRSVRFFPVTEEEETGLQSLKFVKDSIKEDLQMKQTARNILLKSYQKKIDREFDPKHDEDANCCSDDGKSDSSSDLFELDNLAAIGMEKYREELPVYETTRLDTNRAIAYGLRR